MLIVLFVFGVLFLFGLTVVAIVGLLSDYLQIECLASTCYDNWSKGQYR